MAPAQNADLRAQLEALTALVQSMQAEINTLRSQSQSGTPAPSTVSLEHLSQLPKEPQVSAPETFSGKEDLRIYLQQCELCFELQPSRYLTDYQKVGLILSYLRGPAAKWARPYLSNKDHELRKDLSKFTQAINEAYGDPDYELRAASELRALRQTSSAAKYATEFQAIASNLSWNDGALSSQFYEGLKETVKDELAKDPPKTLRQFVVTATRIDNRQYERRNETSKRTTVTTVTTESKPSRSKSATDEGWPDATEKARRKANGLCYYCGDPHTQSNCPKLAEKNATAAVSTITLAPITYPPYRPSQDGEARNYVGSETSP